MPGPSYGANGVASVLKSTAAQLVVSEDDAAQRVRAGMRRLTQWRWPSGFAVVQFPNPPLIVALLASLAGRLTHGTTYRVALSIFYVTLGVWAYEEARHGENWFRHLLGLGFSIYIIISLSQALHA